MKAVLLEDFGDANNLYIGEIDDPKPQRNEVLIEVKAAALNRADILQRKGNYPPPPGASEILGLEMAGVVTETGPHESRWEIGDRVFGLLPGGGYAQRVVTHESMLMPIPHHLSFEEGAGIAEVFLTAHQALNWLAKMERGDTICVHAGASGVGTAAIQLAKLKGAKIFVTASASKHATCLSLGAHFAIDYRSQDFEAVIKRETQGKGVDIVLDFLAASYLNKNLNILAPDGRLIMLAMMGGRMATQVDLGQVLRKRLHIMGSTLRARNLAYKIELTQSFYEAYYMAFEQGELKPVIDSVFSWSQVADAHRYMESNQSQGKIILRID